MLNKTSQSHSTFQWTKTFIHLDEFFALSRGTVDIFLYDKISLKFGNLDQHLLPIKPAHICGVKQVLKKNTHNFSFCYKVALRDKYANR